TVTLRPLRPTLFPYTTLFRSADGVEVLKQGFNVDPLVQKQAACISTMTYNEYGQVLDAGFSADDLVVFNYRDEGVGMLEDGLYRSEEHTSELQSREKLVCRLQ